MSQLTGRKGVLLGGVAAATVALGIGGVAYAVGDDPAPRQGYVTVEDASVTTPAPVPSENSRGYELPREGRDRRHPGPGRRVTRGVRRDRSRRGSAPVHTVRGPPPRDHPAGARPPRGEAGRRRPGPARRTAVRVPAGPGATACSRACRASPRRWPARTLADVVGGSFARIQFTPDLVPADIVGTRVYHPSSETFSIEPGPIVSQPGAGRRDQPGAGQGAVGAARGDGRAAGLGRRPATRCPTRSWCWPPRTRSSPTASTSSPRRSGTAS